jgi:hypothetical protein
MENMENKLNLDDRECRIIDKLNTFPNGVGFNELYRKISKQLGEDMMSKDTFAKRLLSLEKKGIITRIPHKNKKIIKTAVFDLQKEINEFSDFTQEQIDIFKMYSEKERNFKNIWKKFASITNLVNAFFSTHLLIHFELSIEQKKYYFVKLNEVFFDYAFKLRNAMGNVMKKFPETEIKKAVFIKPLTDKWNDKKIEEIAKKMPYKK